MHEVVVADARGHGPDLLCQEFSPLATGGIRTTDQIFAGVVLLLGKTLGYGARACVASGLYNFKMQMQIRSTAAN